MGLDGVELVMEVEDEFGIVLEDEETVEIQTVGRLIHVIERKIASESRQRLGTAFYRLRQVLADSALIDKRLIRPDTDLRPLIPVSQVPAVWNELRDAGFAMPMLALSWRGVCVFFVVWLAMIVLSAKAVTYLTGFSPLGTTVGVLMFFFGWFAAIRLVTWLSYQSLFPWLSTIPTENSTPRGIVRRWRGLSVESSSPVEPEPDDEGVEPVPVLEVPDAPNEPSEAQRIESAFEGLCSVLADAVPIRGIRLTGETPLKSVVPARERWRIWMKLAKEGLPLPPLRLNSTVRVVLALPVLVVSLTGAALTIMTFLLLVDANAIGSALLVAAIGLTLVLLLSTAANEGCTAFGRAHQIWWLVGDAPAEWKTLGDAARWLAKHRWPRSPENYQIRSRDIAIRVRQIVADQMGVSVEKVRPETTFEELGF